MRIFLSCLFSLMLLASSCFAASDDGRQLKLKSDAGTEKRIALVIGNSKYNGTSLANPANDARDVAAALTELGFDVTAKIDVTQKEMNRSIVKFGEKLNANTVALFYYAGHGMQVKGKNYLIPVDAQIDSETAVRAETVDVDAVLDQLNRSPLSIVILDACRNNPFERRFRSIGGGLAAMDAPKGTLIAYATAPGSVASDGTGRNGLYTQELLKAMRAPGLPVERMFKEVRKNVTRATGDAQIPWEMSSLTGEFYFKPGKDSQLANLEPVPAPSGNRVEVTRPVINNASQQNQSEYEIDTDRLGSDYIHYVLDESNPTLCQAHCRDDAECRAWTFVKPEIQGKKALCWLKNAVPNSRFDKCCVSGVKLKDNSHQQYANVELVMIPIPGKNYELGKYEVTQVQWSSVMGNNPSHFSSCGDNCPVESVSWDDIQIYLQKLNENTGKQYRLPTRDEWEYACYGGEKNTSYCGGNDLGSMGWYKDNSNGQTHPVGKKQGNGYGLYDMSGNVQEWLSICNDGKNQRFCEIRGGSWFFKPELARVPNRFGNPPSYRSSGNGFRLARTLP